MTDDDRYLFPPEIRQSMLEMHHKEWDAIKQAEPLRAVTVEQSVASLREAFPELTVHSLADIFAFIVSSLKAGSERGATVNSIVNGLADMCSELTDLLYVPEVADGQ